MATVQKGKNAMQGYTFNRDKPTFSTTNYELHHGKQKETKLPVTIKIVKSYSQDLVKYLKKLKECKSQNTIRVYEIVEQNNCVMMVTEHVGYGNLSNALSKCQRLEEADAITLSKMLLNGYIDLLRTDCTWLGTQQDVEFTESGAKLSWNNNTNFKMQNSIGKVLQRLSQRNWSQSNSILPFPKSKTMQQLIKVSKQSASQISLNPHLKKKQKKTLKKGKSWLGLKQISSKNQYMDQSIYFGVDLQYGFVRIKIYEKGIINQQILNLGKGKGNFTKVLECYEEGNKSIVVAGYSNDGSLQAYVTRLKNSGVKLNQECIQFCFFSLFEPLKQVQQSSTKSIGMLHIKNIYIENGILKIGEPIPMNQKLQAVLKQRQDVPDFYHPQFKQNPHTRSQRYDTYSLGILLYKLMYTEYPIFPQGKVHIPTAPTYSKRLKTTLQILLNEGGNLKSLQSKIQVSDTVKNQVKENKALLEVISLGSQNKHKNSVELSKRALIEDLDQTEDNFQEKKSQEKSEEGEQIVEDELGCCSLCCHGLEITENQHANNRLIRVTTLQQSPYKIYRICTKIILVLLFYSMIFYYYFFQNTFALFSAQSKLQKFNVTIATLNYPITTPDPQAFQTQFNKTSRNLASLQNIGCLIDGITDSTTTPATNYSQFLVTKPSGWIFYYVAGFLCVVLFLGIKAWMVYNFDLIKVMYNWDHGKYGFNFCNFWVFNLGFCCVINGHYYLWNYMFEGISTPCIGSTKYYYSSSYTLFNNIQQFLFPYMTTFLLQLTILILHFIMIWKTSQIPYNKLINPIIIFCPFLITQWINLRIGLIRGYFLPNGYQDNYVLRDYFVNLEYVNMLGTVPEALFVGEILVGAVVDGVYWCFLDKRRRMLIHEASAASLSDIKL